MDIRREKAQTMPLCARHPNDFQLKSTDDELDKPDRASNWNLLASNDELDAIDRALDTCNTCQIAEPNTFKACAKAALKSGLTLDGEFEAVANGAIWAGIECKGDRTTWRKLKQASGETIDETRCMICDRSFLDDVIERGDGICAGCSQVWTRHDIAAPSTPRNTPPDECLECAKPMERGPGPHPTGVVRHAARGYCRTCITKVERNAA